MGIDALFLLKDVLNAQRVEFRVIPAESEGFPVFDNGIREQLFMDFDYSRIKDQIVQNCKERTIYYVTDLFGVHYIIFRNPEDEENYILIGPYLNLVPQDVGEIVEKVGIDLFHVQTLQSYYYEIPEIIPGEPEAKIAVETWTENALDGMPVTIILRDTEGRAVLDGSAAVKVNYARAEVSLENPHLLDSWNR